MAGADPRVDGVAVPGRDREGVGRHFVRELVALLRIRGHGNDEPAGVSSFASGSRGMVFLLRCLMRAKAPARPRTTAAARGMLALTCLKHTCAPMPSYSAQNWC